MKPHVELLDKLSKPALKEIQALAQVEYHPPQLPKKPKKKKQPQPPRKASGPAQLTTSKSGPSGFKHTPKARAYTEDFRESNPFNRGKLKCSNSRPLQSFLEVQQAEAENPLKFVAWTTEQPKAAAFDAIQAEEVEDNELEAALIAIAKFESLS